MFSQLGHMQSQRMQSQRTCSPMGNDKNSRNQRVRLLLTLCFKTTTSCVRKTMPRILRGVCSGGLVV
jgi:hypothetical protein